jgi:hypothetical protein
MYVLKELYKSGLLVNVANLESKYKLVLSYLLILTKRCHQDKEMLDKNIYLASAKLNINRYRARLQCGQLLSSSPLGRLTPSQDTSHSFHPRCSPTRLGRGVVVHQLREQQTKG